MVENLCDGVWTLLRFETSLWQYCSNVQSDSTVRQTNKVHLLSYTTMNNKHIFYYNIVPPYENFRFPTPSKKNILENFSIVFLFVPHYDWKRTHIGIPFLMDIIKTWYCYVFKAELENGEDVARCPSCSLILKVIYDLVSCFYGEAA